VDGVGALRAAGPQAAAAQRIFQSLADGRKLGCGKCGSVGEVELHLAGSEQRRDLLGKLRCRSFPGSDGRGVCAGRLRE